MACLCGLKILLLWAAIICPFTCQSVTSSAGPSSTPTGSPSNITAGPAQTNTTAPVTAPPTPVSGLCSYTVTPGNFGFQISINNSVQGNYTIDVSEAAQPAIESRSTFRGSDKSIDVPHLKPCTQYTHNVTFTDGNNTETCRSSNGLSTTSTSTISQTDIQRSICSGGFLCFESGWDISSLPLTPTRVPCDANTTCIRPGYDDICTDLTTTFFPGSCANFSVTDFVSAYGFLDVNEIKKRLNVSTKFPAKIEVKLPSACSNLTEESSCLETAAPEVARNVSKLEPFTSYNCTTTIKDNGVALRNITVPFRIDCDLRIQMKPEVVRNTSVQLRWTTTSENCTDVQLNKTSYQCSCGQSSSPAPVGGSMGAGFGCSVTGLKPFTSYTCTIQPRHRHNNVGQPETVVVETDVGIPDVVINLVVTLPKHNVIEVKCDAPKRPNGKVEKYFARLSHGSDFQERGNKDCKFEFKDLFYSTEYTLQVFAKNQKHNSTAKTHVVGTLYNDKVVIGFLVFLILFTSVALLLVVYKIYILKRRRNHDLSENVMLISKGHDEDSLLPVEPIATDALLDTYKQKLADEARLFLAEFQSIPRIFSKYTMKEAKKPSIAAKNRYVDILPYDYNRVQLTTASGDSGYINASFIDGYKESKKYIAAQGPKEETVGDFWRMVWEQQSSIIVMVTRCEEGNRVKCVQYWPSPEREVEIFEEFHVKIKSEEHCPDYTIRHLTITNRRDKNTEREVTHIQFMSWPDHGVPGEPHLLLKLRRRVNAFKNVFSGPIVVHCSAGVGRTGTYIGIDAMMESLEAEGKVDIYRYVAQLRRQRCLMVQVEAQYILIHQALVEHNQFGETEIPLSELHSTLSTLKEKTSDDEPTLMEEEFERVPSFKNWRTFNAGITAENKNKNRSSSVVPYDYNRVLLKIDEGLSHESDPDDEDEEEEESTDEEDEDSTKYINASHIDGYWGRRTLIAAQTPLPDTIADFWLMVYQKKASTIVMLSDGSEGEKESVYWDKEKKTFGEVQVEVTRTDASPTFISRNMLIRHVKRKERRIVKQFQFLKWVNRELPEKPQDLTDIIKDIKLSSSISTSQKGMPIVVHCNDGSSRSGIFCALWNLMDSAETEKLVDVFQVAKTIRKERQGLISSVDQYQFLYDALEGLYPVKNGDLKAVQASEADCVQIVNETKAEEKPASSTENNQQGAEEDVPVAADGDKVEEPEMSSSPKETLEDSSNGPVEV